MKKVKEEKHYLPAESFPIHVINSLPDGRQYMEGWIVSRRKNEDDRVLLITEDEYNAMVKKPVVECPPLETTKVI
jgi:hypothetical protein